MRPKVYGFLSRSRPSALLPQPRAIGKPKCTPAQLAVRRRAAPRARAVLADLRAGQSQPAASPVTKASPRVQAQLAQRFRASTAANTRLTAEKLNVARQRNTATAALRRARLSAEADRMDWVADELDPVHARVFELELLLSVAQTSGTALAKKLQAAEKRNQRLLADFNERMERAIAAAVDAATTFDLMQPGHRNYYTVQAKELCRELVALFGVALHYVSDVISCVSRCAGLRVVGHISEGTVRQAIAEGYVASQMQIAEELSQATSEIVHLAPCPFQLT